MATRLYHVSEEGGIERFEPRESTQPNVLGAVVWAVDEEHLPNYLLPRDCPRVTFRRGQRVVAIEEAWLSRVHNARVIVYELPTESFECIDANAGYFVSRAMVVPVSTTVVDNLLDALDSRGVEVRVLPELWTLHDDVASNVAEFSMIRMRNATPRNRC